MAWGVKLPSKSQPLELVCSLQGAQGGIGIA